MSEKKKLLFTETMHCTSQNHCNTCRSKLRGRPFRESVRQSFGTPGDKVDFECPFGFPWEYRLPTNFEGIARTMNRKEIPFKKPIIRMKKSGTGCAGCSRKRARFILEQQEKQVSKNTADPK